MLIENTESQKCIEKWLLNTMPPNFPHYSSKEDRLRSFNTCPESIKVKPNALSDAGFFYKGPDDRTVCFHCGGGLNEWKELDDPWIEHAYWFPRCSYVITVKGKEFVDNCFDKKKDSATLQEMKSVTDVLREIVDIVNSKKKNTPVAGRNVKANRINIPSVKQTCESLCKICFIEEQNMVFLPCKHVVACSKCSSCLSQCAVCREPIAETMRIYPS